jgi:predicted RNase H-like HicB family nuclease
MRTYFAIVHKEEDSAVGVVFPDLPGCFSAGDAYDKAT